MKLVSLSRADQARFTDIKSRAVIGTAISFADKQWILDVAKKLQIVAPAKAIAAAKKQGYDTVGVKVRA